MKKLTGFNLILLFLSLSLSICAAAWGQRLTKRKVIFDSSHSFVQDEQGKKVPVYPYQRIVSMAINCDEILQAIIEKPARILAFTQSTLKGHPDPHLFQGRPYTYNRTGLEVLLNWNPDLILVAGHTDISMVSRLREAGIQVFNIGNCRGIHDYLTQIKKLGTLLQVEKKAQHYAKTLKRRLFRVAKQRPEAKAPTALYLGVYGSEMFGGGKKTSYHDVITFAGLRDAAAENGIEGFVTYSVEKLLEINPDIIICGNGTLKLIQKIPGAQESLKAVRENKIYEFPPAILSSAGSLMLNAAEEVRAAILGDEF